MNNLPHQTALIFEVLSKGQFICSSSRDEQTKILYSVLDDEDVFDSLYEYFVKINFILEKGDNYYYFSRKESKVDLERKIEQALRWIDYYDFLLTFNPYFGVGTRFQKAQILVDLPKNADLKNKLEHLKKHTKDKETHDEILTKIISELEKDQFVELENASDGTYKVLDSYHYFVELIKNIHIPEELLHEISE
jgi:hypothetical protein